MIIGVTGNIASGKTEVATLLKEMTGGAVVDADAIGRYLLESNPEIQRRVRLDFGADAVDLNTDRIDRKKLSRFVFSGPDNLIRLNRIFYPHMIAEVRTSIMKALRVFRHVILDAALIVEWNFQGELDFLVCVTAPRELRLMRLMEKRRILEDDAQNMIDAQTPDDLKASVADAVISNTGTLEELRLEAEKVAKKLDEKEKAE